MFHGKKSSIFFMVIIFWELQPPPLSSNSLVATCSSPVIKLKHFRVSRLIKDQNKTNLFSTFKIFFIWHAMWSYDCAVWTLDCSFQDSVQKAENALKNLKSHALSFKSVETFRLLLNQLLATKTCWGELGSDNWFKRSLLRVSTAVSALTRETRHR